MTRCRLYWCGGKQLTSHVSRMFATSQFTDVNLFPSNALCVNSDLKKTKFWGNLAFFIHFLLRYSSKCFMGTRLLVTIMDGDALQLEFSLANIMKMQLKSMFSRLKVR